MAATEYATLNVTLTYGQNKIPIHLDVSSQDDGSKCLTVGHLIDQVYKETNVEPACQKLIHRGRALNKADDSNSNNTKLSTLGIRNGDRIMLLSRKVNDASTLAVSNGYAQHVAEGKSRLEDLQSQVDRVCLQCDENIRRVQDTKELQGLKTSKLSFISLHEDSMKLLEKIDATTSNDNEEFRKQRKMMVNTIQGKLDICEKLIADITKKILHLEQMNASDR
ncbi:uncharacterized protein LOC131957129 [Physella acuta]|uniref:uncharacterized protein LOC131957129 n=1 Tax=Physella acuta TaxID=109671 RepID=UPI0027DCB97A|nr:uncharacterized protein LOC131957129 [Physella acuta]